MHNLSPIQQQQIADTRYRIDGARLLSALRHGELRRSHSERLDILTLRMRAHRRAGRLNAARAVARRIEALLDEMEAM